MKLAIQKENITTENIWHDFSERLREFISSRIKNAADVDDILQDIFLKVHLKKETIKDNHKLTSWLFQVTRNTIIDHYRQSGKLTQLSNVSEIPETKNSLCSRELADCLTPFIKRLSKPEQDLIYRIDLQGEKQQDVAFELNMPYSTLKTKVQRARKKLRQLFLEGWKTQNYLEAFRDYDNCSLYLPIVDDILIS